MKKYALLTFVVAFGFLSISIPLAVRSAHAQDNTTRDFVSPIVFQATGPNAASIQSVVDVYRAALGNPNNGNAGSMTGHREINLDGAACELQQATLHQGRMMTARMTSS